MAEGGKRSLRQGSGQSFLDSIPGWSGYRDREGRRESDRLLRERLARDYGEIADRLGRLASRMANDREIRAIRYVDDPHGRLNHFIDRLKAATYGYAGLFSDRPVDEQALDQIAAFDASLGDSLEPLDKAAAALEQTDPDDDAFRARSEELTGLIETLLDRFDRRAELIESGDPQPEAEITALLGTSPQPGFTPTAYQLHDGDAITFRGVNYTVVGRISVETPAGTWRDFQLQGGDGRSWLHVPGSAGGRFVWYQRVEPQGQGGDRELTVDGARYELTGSVEGTAEVIGSGGSSGSRDMTAHSYRQVEGESVVSVYHWRADDIALAGEPIDATELELWSREGGQAI